MYKSLAKTLFVGKKVIYLPSCHSTNDVASERIANDQWSAGDIIITSNQTAGKGQRGNLWQSNPDENLTFSILLRPQFLRAHDQFNLNIAISLGIVEYLNSLRAGFMVKWPNDIYFNEQKLCGILIQNNLKGKFLESSIVGIGLNINQREFENPKATSLALILNRPLSLIDTFDGICSFIEGKYLQLKSDQISVLKEQYLNRLLGFKKKRKFENDRVFEGIIKDTTASGKLIIETGLGLEEFDLKEIKFL